MSRLRVVGNDVVDLQDSSTCGKHTDQRFTARVLADGERAALSASSDPAVELWAVWAAKEAAYKVASKLRGEPPVFVHAAFRVTWTEAGADRWTGRVAHEELELPVEVVRSGAVVHAVAVSEEGGEVPWVGVELLDTAREDWPARLEELRSRFTPREADAVHSLPSAAVRIRARAALATTLGAEEADVEIVCDPGVTGRRPPRAFLMGRPAPADVSLSHHGSWIGWAVLSQNPVGR